MLTEEYLQRLVDQCLPAARQGKVASYIPKLAGQTATSWAFIGWSPTAPAWALASGKSG